MEIQKDHSRISPHDPARADQMLIDRTKQATGRGLCLWQGSWRIPPRGHGTEYPAQSTRGPRKNAVSKQQCSERTPGAACEAREAEATRIWDSGHSVQTKRGGREQLKMNSPVLRQGAAWSHGDRPGRLQDRQAKRSVLPGATRHPEW